MDYSMFENCSLFAGIPAKDLRTDFEAVPHKVRFYISAVVVFERQHVFAFVISCAFKRFYLFSVWSVIRSGVEKMGIDENVFLGALPRPGVIAAEIRIRVRKDRKRQRRHDLIRAEYVSPERIDAERSENRVAVQPSGACSRIAVHAGEVHA